MFLSMISKSIELNKQKMREAVIVYVCVTLNQVKQKEKRKERRKKAKVRSNNIHINECSSESI
jgi:hypothetical protein